MVQVDQAGASGASNQGGGGGKKRNKNKNRNRNKNRQANAANQQPPQQDPVRKDEVRCSHFYNISLHIWGVLYSITET